MKYRIKICAAVATIVLSGLAIHRAVAQSPMVTAASEGPPRMYVGPISPGAQPYGSIWLQTEPSYTTSNLLLSAFLNGGTQCVNCVTNVVLGSAVTVTGLIVRVQLGYAGLTSSNSYLGVTNVSNWAQILVATNSVSGTNATAITGLGVGIP